MRRYIYSTNKSMLQATRLSAFRDLHLGCTQSVAASSLEQYSSLASFYLIDRVHKEGFYKENFDAEMQKYFSEIFVNELSETSIPKDSWPDHSNYSVFKSFIKIKEISLTSDFSSQLTLVTKHYLD